MNATLFTRSFRLSGGFLVFLLGLGSLPDAAQAQAGATVTWVQGTVEVYGKGAPPPRPVMLDAQLQSGDRLVTKAASSVQFALADGSVVKMGELATLDLKDLSFEKTSGAGVSTLQFVWGKVRAVVSKITVSRGRFEIRTPSGIAGVTGTDLGVEVGQGVEDVLVFGGEATMTDPFGGRLAVRSGQFARFVSGRLEARVLAMPPERIALWDRLMKIHVQKEKPKVMILFDEKVAGIFGTTAWEQMGQMEAILMERFLATGFVVVDPQTVRANVSRDKALRLLEGDAKAAAVAGLQHGAQVVVTGKALTKPAGGKLLGTQMQSIQATVQARVVRTDDARVLASRTASGVQAHIDEVQGGALALREAGNQLADQVIDDILTQWEQEVYVAQEVQVVISGLASHRQLQEIKGHLTGALPGVKAVHERSFTKGTAELGLDFGGKTGEIADTLFRRRFSGFRLEPTSVTPNRVELRVVVEPAKKKGK